MITKNDNGVFMFIYNSFIIPITADELSLLGDYWIFSSCFIIFRFYLNLFGYFYQTRFKFPILPPFFHFTISMISLISV